MDTAREGTGNDLLSRRDGVTPEESNGEFSRRMTRFIERVYPDEFSLELVDPHRHRIQQFEEMFRWLDEIYAHRERYDLHWAFHEAEEVFRRQMDLSGAGIDQCLRQHYSRENRLRLTALTSRMDLTARRKSAAINRKTMYFSTISDLVSLIDIVISVILIVIISEIAHFGNTLFDSVVLILLFTGIIALLKVTLDRFFIIPRVRRWGWKKYLEEVRITKQILVEVKAVSVVVMKAIREERDPEETYRLIEAGIREISFI